ncbi:hypothetical protein J6590_043497 [Homalodisca vitripennis]|nr:hypothetical protein J6590_043497 [Homalodisca vitripennis]
MYITTLPLFVANDIVPAIDTQIMSIMTVCRARPVSLHPRTCYRSMYITTLSLFVPNDIVPAIDTQIMSSMTVCRARPVSLHTRTCYRSMYITTLLLFVANDIVPAIDTQILSSMTVCRASKSPYADLLQEYVAAEVSGQQDGECWRFYKGCPKSLFQNPHTKKYSKEEHSDQEEGGGGEDGGYSTSTEKLRYPESRPFKKTPSFNKQTISNGKRKDGTNKLTTPPDRRFM